MTRRFVTLVALAALSALALPMEARADEPDAVVRYWTDQLRASDSRAREAAARGLELSGRSALSSLAALAAALDDEAPSVRVAACRAIGSFGLDGSAASERLARLLAEDSSEDVRAAAAAALRDVGRRAPAAATAHLQRALTSGPEDARASAAEVLGRMEHPPEACVAALERQMLRDPSRKARTSARAALDRLGRESSRLAPGFKAGLDDEDPAIRERAAAWYRDQPELAGPALARLATLATRDANDDVRHAASAAIAAAGDRAAFLSPALIADLSSGDTMVRAQAARLLGRAGSGTQVEVSALMAALAGDSQLQVRQRARSALVHLASEHPLVVMDVASRLESSDEELAVEAAEVLSATGEDAAAAGPALGKAAAEGPEPLRLASVQALGRMGHRAAPERERLEQALRDRSARVRAAARRALDAIERADAGEPAP